MTKDSSGLYVYEVPENLQNGKVLFNAGPSGPQIPAQDQPGLEIGGSSKLYQNGDWMDYEPENRPIRTQSRRTRTPNPLIPIQNRQTPQS